MGRFRVLLAVLAAAALFAASDTVHTTVEPTLASGKPAAPAIYLNTATVEPLDLEHQLQVLVTPRTRPEYMKQIAKGEKIREQHVVESAAKTTLARAKAEAAAAIAGQTPQSMMGGATSTTAGAILPGVTGYVVPAKGIFTSGFGTRWGTLHAGIDIAGPIGTPEYAVANGTVIDAGPASGFGLWVRIRLDDGTILVYGHMYDFFVSVGERVPAGMQIARMGNRGDSTGPHLHFEVIMDGQHVDPQRWLALHGINVG